MKWFCLLFFNYVHCLSNFGVVSKLWKEILCHASRTVLINISNMETIVLPYSMYTTHQQYQYVAMVYIRRQLVAHMFCNLYPKQHLLGVVLLLKVYITCQESCAHLNNMVRFVAVRNRLFLSLLLYFPYPKSYCTCSLTISTVPAKQPRRIWITWIYCKLISWPRQKQPQRYGILM